MLIALELEQHLENFEYEVIDIVGKGQEAIEKTLKHDPDIVLMDIRLKDSVSGIQASQEILKKKDIPIIFLTANADAKTINEAKKINPYAFLVKPLDPKELKATLEVVDVKFQAEQKLKISNSKFQSIFMGNPEPAVYLDLDFKVIDINPRFTDIFGYDLDDIEHQYIDDFIIPAGREKEAKKFSKESEKAYLYKQSIRKTKNGELIPVEISAAPIFVDNKQTGAFVLYKDIRQRKKTESALKLQQTYLQQLFNSAPEGIVLCKKDGEIIRANKEFLQLFDYEKEDIIGKPLDFLISTEELKEAQEITQKVSNGNLVNTESVRRRKDGSPVQVSIMAKPIFLDDEMIGIYAIYRDITERMNSQKEREKLITELQNALNEVKNLSGLIPICAHCKKIRDDKGYWNRVEDYLADHSDVAFSHAICPDCIKKYYPKQYKKLKDKGKL